ncbi:transglycosylase SLT domain-containing protein [Microbacterium sp. YY-01]|uniref:aggregation-promoting factor C-terminal-like domain-containing protein n=1 Tax=Microbacterium sp. YY-01 TaxID=3421634 RepID=UPI003D1686A0
MADIVTPDNDLILKAKHTLSASLRGTSTAKSQTGAAANSRHQPRRRATGILAGLAVMGFSAAIIAPTGLALAGSSSTATAADATTAFSVASNEVQSLKISVEGSSAEPLARGTFEVYVPPPPEPEPKPASADSDDSGSDSGGGDVGPVYYDGGGDPAAWMAAAGIASSDWGYVDYIATRESGWNPNATNPSSGACGLIQALPCSKVPGNGYDPVDNLRWANGYAMERYGSWYDAYVFWVNNSWW